MSRAPGVVRIIGGRFKRTPVPVLDAVGLRPTPDRVRETLFNWLGQDLSAWVCLDAFAGTGVLGLEALSRGAARVDWIEKSPLCLSRLRSVLQKLSCPTDWARTGDGVQALQACAPGSLDLVFLDPPYALAVHARALAAAAVAVRPGGWAYLEADRDWPADTLAALGWQPVRSLRAGQVHAHLLQRTLGSAATYHPAP